MYRGDSGACEPGIQLGKSQELILRAAVWQYDPDIVKARKWTIAAPIQKGFPRAQQDEEGNYYVDGYLVCPGASGESIVESARFYHNPLEHWQTWGFHLVQMYLSLEKGVLTLNDYCSKPTAALIQALEVVGQELTIFRRELARRDDNG